MTNSPKIHRADYAVVGSGIAGLRAAIELSAVTIGIVLGGTFGVGTVAFALAIGPAVQAAVHRIGGTDTSRL